MSATVGQSARALQTPRAAGAAGILFALLVGTAMALARSALPVDPAEATNWLAGSSHSALHIALILLPFAGIFFLWFMGSVRNLVGEAEDKFFATLFLGSGILFVAVLYALAAVVGALLAVVDTSQPIPQLWQYGRELTLTLLSSYSTRLGAVFTISTTTIGHRLGLLPRWLTWAGYVAAAVLLFAAGSIPWSELVFPLWVLTVSGYIFAGNFVLPPTQVAA